jgi:hypothetical protein
MKLRINGLMVKILFLQDGFHRNDANSGPQMRGKAR